VSSRPAPSCCARAKPCNAATMRACGQALVLTVLGLLDDTALALLADLVEGREEGTYRASSGDPCGDVTPCRAMADSSRRQKVDDQGGQSQDCGDPYQDIEFDRIGDSAPAVLRRFSTCQSWLSPETSAGMWRDRPWRATGAWMYSSTPGGGRSRGYLYPEYRLSLASGSARKADPLLGEQVDARGGAPRVTGGRRTPRAAG
jgi:hypothetical protein